MNLLLLATSFLLLARPAAALEAAGVIAPRSCLVVGPVTRGGRYALHRDPVEAQIVAGRWSAPHEGDVVPGVSGEAGTWKALEADKDGWFASRALSGGYAYVSVPSDRARVMTLEAAGHSMVYINGVPRTGDPYATGYVRLPVLLRAGANDLLFSVGRGRFRARLVPPTAPQWLDAADSTLPDLIRGERARMWGALIVANGTNAPARGLAVEASGPGLRTTRTPVPPLLPLGTRKVAFRIEGAPPADVAIKEVRVTLRLVGSHAVQSAPPVTVALRVREPGQTYKCTFVSDMDGSVQYYAVNPPPAQHSATGGAKPALVLTLHGAGVEAIGQADAYASKSWAYLVAPTNRRPYGFDWEDWGRLDALEVLAQAKSTLDTDPKRVYLTGHSMGGHGVWTLGGTFPDHWAAIGPSAGWISFYSYGGGRRVEEPSPVEAILQRASASSDTLAMEHNYAMEGVYILHGGADDNVPVTEARHMAEVLAGFHHDFQFHEQPGVGHWWSIGDEPGARCVDWPPMFDLFARHALPAESMTRDVDFTTVNPAVSASCRWLTIAQQVHPLQASSAKLQRDPHLRRFTGTTENVALLGLDTSVLDPGPGPVLVELDGQKVTIGGQTVRQGDKETRRQGDKERGEGSDNPQSAILNPQWIWLRRDGDRWSIGAAPGAAEKGPERGGPFKQAFRHRMLFVYGTRGTAEESAWALAKARYDAETFWYRGNGSVDVVADTEFDARREPDRSVILYGNADMNAAWGALLGGSPVQVRRDGVRVGSRDLRGADLACLFLRPRPGSAVACVGVVGGTGIAGMRLTDRTPVFLSGAGFPDCLVLGPESLTEGAAGVRAAGSFGNDWSVERGEWSE